MILTMGYVFVILVAVLAFGGWAFYAAIQQSKRASERSRAIGPQQLSGLAQPYRGLMGEAYEIYQDVHKQSQKAPKMLARELSIMAERMQHLISRALPHAQHGTDLAGLLVKLKASDPHFDDAMQAAKATQADLEQFVDNLKLLRGKVYKVITDASKLGSDKTLAQDLDDALIDISALEEAFAELENV
jgi:hypothetical protein